MSQIDISGKGIINQNLPDIGDLWLNWQNTWEVYQATETSALKRNAYAASENGKTNI